MDVRSIMLVVGRESSVNAFKAILTEEVQESNRVELAILEDQESFIKVTFEGSYTLDVYSMLMTTLGDKAKEYRLSIEVYSYAAEDEFAEHYHYIGDCEWSNEKVRYKEYVWDKDLFPTLDVFNEHYGTKFYAFEEKEGGLFVTGGFMYHSFFMITPFELGFYPRVVLRTW